MTLDLDRDAAGGMSKEAFTRMQTRHKADAGTRAVALALVGTCDASADDVAERIEEDYDETVLYAIVDVCGDCYWWHNREDLRDCDDAGNGLACDDCTQDRGTEEAT